MIKYIQHKLTAITALLFLLQACDFGDTNVPPDQPEDVGLSALLPTSEATLGYTVGGELVRFSGLFMQYFAGTNAQQADDVKYNVSESATDGSWQNLYENTMNPVNIIIQKATEQNAPHYRGIARVLMAVALGNTTDCWGDIPYSEAFQANIGVTQPGYDGQENVYNTIQALLDDAIVDLQETESAGGSPGGDDLIYSGDLESWIKAARALKVRYYLQTAKVNTNAYQEALAIIQAEMAITSNGEDFEMIFGTAANEPHPQYQFQQDRLGNIDICESCVAEINSDGKLVLTRNVFLLDELIRLGDPRLASFVETDKDGKYLLTTSTFYTKINATAPLMSYAELKFIEAEALLKTGAAVTEVEAALSAAITASLTKILGSTDATYVTTNSMLSGLADDEARLAKIIEQKYIAMYSHGVVAWSDYRRTGYPVLTPHPEGEQSFNENGEVPRRLPYPLTERLNNGPNIPVTTPNLQDRFWWDK